MIYLTYVDNPIKSPLTTISIGPGIRGIERGVERVTGLVHLAYVEIEAFIIENLVAQMECGVLDPAVIWSDAKTLPCEIFRGITDILLAGYPCQPFSTAGKRRGSEDPRHLYPYIERAIRIIRPRICFFENVRGHVTCGLPEVIASLEGLGYRVHWGIYSAEETGAAHKRERVFIMAYSQGAGKRRGERYIHQEDGRPDGELPLIVNGTSKELENTIHSGMRGRGNDQPDGECKIQITGPSELENPASLGCGSFRTESTGFERSAITDNAGDELADTISDESERNGRSGGMEDSQGPNQSEEDERQRVRDATRAGSEAMALTNEQRFKAQWNNRKQIEAKYTGITRGRISGPGQPQQAWEHPRVISRKIESSVGLSAHGYHFREDILRALGNSVYEDTSELAFRDLARKHGINL